MNNQNNENNEVNAQLEREKEEKLRAAVERWMGEISFIPTQVAIDLQEAGHEFTLLGEYDEEEGSDYPTEGHFPMWGTMFTFKNSLDDQWLQDSDNIQVMRDCGFHVYESEHFDYIFGIDGAGYDFYEAHWTPLYLKRGLQWHLS